ncbi:MAG: chorismate synthase [Peptococcaceae bacterium]|jgi:chorismate synthase|nr:chorismate synthase [Peptococcaceae bacterium]
MNTWGNALRLSIFGESHGPAVGIIIDGLPPGERIDLALVGREMARRAPGQETYATARREADAPEILSGLWAGKTTGAPLGAIIRNQDSQSGDYDTKLRPGHADWTALLKYGGHADMRGGGHFSGRLTAPLVFAGAVAKQLLARRGTTVLARIVRIGEVEDTEAPIDSEAYRQVADRDFPAGAAAGERMKAVILAAKAAGDSVGGIVEATALGLPGGLGEPFFGSLESGAAALLFSIPAVKGVEFGEGFRFAGLLGSQANDELYLDQGAIRAYTNHNGGILGGITNGLPVVVRAALKPTPSIAKPQRTVDSAEWRETELRISGRHDPCVAPRAAPAVAAALALSLLDCLLAAARLAPIQGGGDSADGGDQGGGKDWAE